MWPCEVLKVTIFIECFQWICFKSQTHYLWNYISISFITMWRIFQLCINRMYFARFLLFELQKWQEERRWFEYQPDMNFLWELFVQNVTGKIFCLQHPLVNQSHLSLSLWFKGTHVTRAVLLQESLIILWSNKIPVALLPTCSATELPIQYWAPSHVQSHL